MIKTRTRIFLIVAIIFVVILLLYKYVINTPRLDVKNIKEMSITALPSPPKVKNVTNKEDIEKFVIFFNSIKVNTAIDQTSKGWQIRIQTNGAQTHTIYFMGNKLSFDGVWYSIEDRQLDEMNKLYQSFNYPEENIYNQK